MAVPIAVGWWAGDVRSGLIATIGAFTALYGAGTPFACRGRYLAVVAASFAVAVALGDWSAQISWLGVVTVSLVAVLAVLVCNALAVGPPGAYMFVLTCAVGVGLSPAGVSPVKVGALVLAGGAFAWVVHMAGMVLGVRRPERRAVDAASTAVSAYVAAVGSPDERRARHQAASALYDAWIVLMNQQPSGSSAGVERLRGENVGLHGQFAEAMTGGRAAPLGDVGDVLPLGRPGILALLRHAGTPGSGQLVVAARVGAAVLVAGFVATALGEQRAYWAMAAAVLVLHQGLDHKRTLRRALDRTVGTWIGLLVAGAILVLHPGGLVLAALAGLLVFLIEMMVTVNYAAAVVFITAVALTISSAGHPEHDIGEILISRGVDTLIGCLVATAVYLASASGRRPRRLRDRLAALLDAVADVVPHIVDGTVTTPAALVARREVQLRAIGLTHAYDDATAGSNAQRAAAEELWPAVAAAEQLAYRLLAACWRIQRGIDTDPATNATEGQRLAAELDQLRSG